MRECDLRTEDFEPDRYDLVHCRSVLMHLPDKRDALARLVDAVRPGGRLCAEEGDWGLMTLGGHPEAEWANALRERMLAATEGRTPLDIRFGRALPGLFVDLGLADIGGDGATTLARQGDPTFVRHRMDMAHVAAAARRVGSASEHELDRFEAILGTPDVVLVGGTSVGVWGRKSS